METRFSILLIDDDPFARQLFTLALEPMFDVHAVSSATEALDGVMLHVADLILVDKDMPDMDGFALLEQLRDHRALRDTPAVMLTSSDDTHDILRARSLGVVGFFTKTTAPLELAKRLGRVLTAGDVVWIDDFSCVTRAPVMAPPRHAMLGLAS